MIAMAQVLARERGQAAVELLGAVPFVLLVGALVWELALAGQTAWLGANAARVAARAAAVGRDARTAARSALPGSLERGMRVDSDDDRVRVRLRVPLIVRSWHGPVSITASARLGDGG